MPDYKIVEGKAQTFLALIKNFPNNVANNVDDYSIPDFWDECDESGLIASLLGLLPDGKKDLYGICIPAAKNTDYFGYGIGISCEHIPEDADLTELIARGCVKMEIEERNYAVFTCSGDPSAIKTAWKFINDNFNNSQYKIAEAPDFEVYREVKEKETFCELWVPLV